ncbi:MAG: TatD family hydrolase [Methanobrevibacter boviskoreani]|jgi:predicted metal-dependent TIM-barrel fold hydrolase|uniref:TatD family hydrolase n=1 Tax=Methanobrevibacter TaxID=2172 RepID=UPI0003348423|nr:MULTISPECIES: TatD family hydrolase [Methanobrevibacter]AGN17237.1 hydrolase TatD family [Methanobrevibacter sp. AbM4]MDD6256960.1 TatD family hydrolase [Methanobrevibacter boviskoreani]
MIDTHTHCDSRSSEDFEKMYVSGIDTAITCAFYPYKLMNETVYLNHLERILKYDTKRAAEYGLDLKVALGIHPANANIKPDLIYENLYKYIEKKQIVAIGEIGLEDLTDQEIKVFIDQLKIADETNTKVIIHTPRKHKKEVLKEIKSIVLDTIDPKLVVIDHVNKDVVNDVIDEDFTLGLTVQPQKMEVSEAVDILDEHGFKKFLLNSDISNKPSNPLSVPLTVRTLKKLGYPKKDIKKVSHKNAEKFFKI